MIGLSRRAARPAVLVALVLIGLGGRSPDPAIADASGHASRLTALNDAVAAARAALDRLEPELQEARDLARQGAALVVAGTSDPAPFLVDAAAALESAAALDGGSFAATQDARRVLAGRLAAIRPDLDPPQLSLSGTDLLQIAAGFRDSSEPAALFVERRHQVEAATEALAAAVEALDAGEVEQAVPDLEALDATLSELAAWPAPPSGIGYWLTIIGALRDAAWEIVDAQRSGDPGRIAAAADAYEEASRAALGADTALAVALSEGGAAVTAAPLQALAGVLAEVAAARQAVEQLATREDS